MSNKFDAVYALVGGQLMVEGDIVRYFSGQTPPTEAQITAKLAELQAAEPMKYLRVERNRRLAVTDWMGNTDIVMSDAWKTHRQALRDLPASANPTLDENGNLTNVTWPEEPS